MDLKQAADRLKAIELKMSEVYLWCSITFDDLEIRQFFSDMSDQELAHARRLDEIGAAPFAADISIDLPEEVVRAEADRIDDMRAFVKTRPGLDETLAKVAAMESGELNVIFESLCNSTAVGEKMINAVCINTKFHINLLKRAVEKFPVSDATRQMVYDIRVRDKDYYKVFSD